MPSHTSPTTEPRLLAVPAHQRVVVVLGMHRSGTSAITRALLELGVELGDDLMPPMEGNNPTGFWEDMGIYRRSEQLLASLGRRWNSVSLIEPWRWESPEVRAAQQDMVEYLRETFGKSALFGFKDPRTCRLLPFWKSVLAALGAEPDYLIVLRNPLSVAQSLAARDGIPEEQSHLLWLEHMVEAMCDSEGAPRLVVDYDRLMEVPARELDRIGKAFGLARAGQDAAAAIPFEGEFLREELRHTRFDARDLKGHPEISKLVCRVFDSLRQLAAGSVIHDNSSARQVWHAARTELEDFAPFLSHLEAQLAKLKDQARAQDELLADVSRLHTALEDARRSYSATLAQLVENKAESGTLADLLTERDAHIATLNGELVDRDQQIATLNGSVAEGAHQIATLNGILIAKDQQIAGLTRTVAEREAQIAVLHGVAGERDTQVAALTQRVAEQAAAMSSAAQTLDAKRAELELVLRSKSWRLTAPLRAVRRGKQRAMYVLREFVSRLARAAYRAMPLPMDHKLRVKNGLFRAFPSVFARTAAYKSWEAFNLNLVTGSTDVREEDSGAAPTRAKSRRSWGGLVADSGSPSEPAIMDRPSESILAELFAEARAGDYQEYRDQPRLGAPVKLIAFYLPQFHPIPENDSWWGKGFTEWVNVTKAKPQFRGHYQPRLPGELGFYDLRIPQVMRRQVELALNYGIGGFCFYFYWFGGKRLLETPLDTYLQDKSLRLPFCLCWANENWSRRWDGSENEILIAQQHSPEDDIAFIKAIERYFADERYIRVRGRPLLIVYRPSLLPDARATVLRWRQHCESAGLGNPLLVMAQTFGDYDPLQYGFDAAVEFPPHNQWPSEITGSVELLNPHYSGRVFEYGSLVDAARNRPERPYLTFRTVCPSWDNQARRTRGANTYVGSTPGKYKEWLSLACSEAAARETRDERIVFVNAWNEWGEGAYLEPDRRYGYAYLQATAEALHSVTGRAGKRIVVVSHDAHPMGAQYLALHLARSLATHFGFGVDLVLLDDGPMKSKFSEVADVHELFSAADEDQALHMLEELHARGASLAICNTTVSGKIAGALKAAGFVVLSLVHELPGLIRSRGLEKAAEAIASHADCVVFPAECVRRGFAEFAGVPAERQSLRPQGLYARNRHRAQRERIRARVRAELGLPAGARIVLGVGHGDFRKGIDLFARVAQEVAALTAEAHFVWVGYQDRELLARSGVPLADNGLPRTVVAVPHQEDVGPLFAASDLYLLSSREDPFPFVMQHAFDAGIPVLGFEGAGGFAEICDPRMGRLVPYEDTGAMARAVVSILQDTDFLKGCLDLGPAIVGDKFDFDEYVRDLLVLGGLRAPRVSVVVPNYNYTQYLELRLNSIISQTYRPYEILFLDDCSTDGSDALAEKLLEGCGIPYRIVRNQENQGVYRQWLRGLQMARGDLVWIAEADDYCDDDFLESLITPFEDPEVVLAYCQSKQVDESGCLVGEDYLAWTQDIDPQKWLGSFCRNGLEELADSLVVKNTIPNASAVLFRKFDASRFAEELATFTNAGDWFVYSQILKSGKIAFLPDALNHHRRHAGSVTQGVAELRLMKEILRVQTSIASQHPVDWKTWERVHRSNQAAYEHLLLASDKAPDYRQHHELMPLVAELTALEKCGRNPEARGREPAGAAAGDTAGALATPFSALDPEAWFDLVCESYRTPRGDGLAARLPAFPPDSLQEGTTGLHGEATLRQAFAFYRRTNEALERAGCVATHSSKLLDFGVGWGRIARFFLREFPPENIYGIDVDPGLVRITQECFRSGHFSACSPFPPTAFASGSFDCIVAYSVFSHLSEQAALAWVAEFARLLRSGGIAVLTTRHRSFLEFCERLKTSASSDYEKGLASMFESFDDARRRYDAGEFLHSSVRGVAGSGPREGGYYGETFIPEAYVRRTFSRWFIVRSFKFGIPDIDQAVIELQKP